jgi:SOS response regulatory protein OraA/RecX
LHGGWRFKKAGGIRLENENASAKVKEGKPRQQKKKGKIAQVYKLHQKGVSANDIAEKMKLNERVVRSYIWRMKNPEKYKELLKRYFEKRKQKTSPPISERTPKQTS